MELQNVKAAGFNPGFRLMLRVAWSTGGPEPKKGRSQKKQLSCFESCNR